MKKQRRYYIYAYPKNSTSACRVVENIADCAADAVELIFALSKSDYWEKIRVEIKRIKL